MSVLNIASYVSMFLRPVLHYMPDVLFCVPLPACFCPLQVKLSFASSSHKISIVQPVSFLYYGRLCLYAQAYCILPLIDRFCCLANDSVLSIVKSKQYFNANDGVVDFLLLQAYYLHCDGMHVNRAYHVVCKPNTKNSICHVKHQRRHSQSYNHRIRL